MPSKPVVVRPEDGIPDGGWHGIPVFCLHDAMSVFPILRVMNKKNLSWLRPDTQPAPHDPAINCVPVHRFLSPDCYLKGLNGVEVERLKNGLRLLSMT
jgi:hypothetical protein